MTGGVVLPGYVTAPIGAVLMLAILVHLIVLAPRVQPPSRRRIRTACGLIMALAIPLVVLGFSVIPPARQPALWAMTWIAASGLTALALCLALLDILNTMRLARRQRTRLRHDMRELRTRWPNDEPASGDNHQP